MRLLPFVLLAACADGQAQIRTLPPEVSAIRIYYSDEKPECAYENVTMVEGRSGAWDSKGDHNEAITNIKIAAYNAGATAVLFKEPIKPRRVVRLVGYAIRCR